MKIPHALCLFLTALAASVALGGSAIAAPASAKPASEKSAPASTSYLGTMGGALFQNAMVFTENSRLSPSLSGDDGVSVQLLYGLHRDGGLGVEFSLWRDIIETGTGKGTDFYRTGAGVDLVYAFGDRIGFTPFMLIGGGGAYNDMTPDTAPAEISGYGNFGLGFVTPALGKGVHLRAEGRYIYDDARQPNGVQGIEDIRVSLGLEVALWDRPEPTIVYREKIKTVEVVKECAPMACPAPPVRVDAENRPLPKVMQLRDVTFDFNKATLRPHSKVVLNSVVEILGRYPEMLVEVAGHTDDVGSDIYNQKLSESRAQSVRQYLIDAGINGGNIVAIGYGEGEPIATNGTAEGRELNRRVELRIKN